MNLARAAWAEPREGSPDLAPILEAAAAVLEVERVSFWRLNADQHALRCQHLFLAREGRHIRAGAPELPALVSARPFEGIDEARVIHTSDAARDPHTRELLAAYLERFHIASLLDAPVRLAGQTIGVLRHEHVGEEARPFGGEERLLASSLADFVALALEGAGYRKAEERLDHASLHDPLTDLPNRRLFLERADRSLRVLERRTGLVAVLSVRVDRTGVPGTNASRDAGEQLLVAAARALVGVLRPADTPARLEGEDFGVLIDRLDEPWEAIAVAERVLAALGQPLASSALSREQAPPGARPRVIIGMAMADGSHPTTATQLLRDAESARARAQERGGSRYEVFETTLRRDVLERMRLGWALRDALSAGQLVVEYQPELALPSRRLLGLEALLRWDRPGHGRLLAGSFLDLAESSGLIVPIGAWVLREACQRARAWRQDPRAASLGLRVNLSARQFEEPALVDTVAAALADAGLPASALCLEITETVLMSNAAASLGTLTALKALGVSLAVDDFGIGYSSLAYLKRFPVDTLKIDRSFVEGLGTDPIDLPIVQAILSLGKTLGLQVVAEGVERPLQEQTLRALGCERAQGFLYSRAMPASEVPSLFSAA